MNLDRFLLGRLVRDPTGFLRIGMARFSILRNEPSLFAVTLRLGKPNLARGKML